MSIQTEPKDGDLCVFEYAIPCRFKTCRNKTIYGIVAVSQNDIKAVCPEHMKLMESKKVFDFGHCPLCVKSVTVEDVQNHLAVVGYFRPNFTPCWSCTINANSFKVKPRRR